MRILLLSNIFPPGFIGGYELGALDMARGLADRGHEVAVLTSDYFVDDAQSLAGLPVARNLQCIGVTRLPSDQNVSASMGKFILPHNLRQIAGEIIRFQPDRVLCFNLAGLGVPGLLQHLVALGHRPVAFLMDNVFQEMAADADDRAAFARVFGAEDWLDAAQWIFMSQNLRREVEATLNRTIPYPVFIPGWFDPTLVPAEIPIADHARVEEDGDAPIRFLFSSRIAPHKGINAVIEAARSLVENGHDNFQIDVYGAGDVTQLLQNITALQLQDHVRYQGCLTKEKMLPRFGGYDALLFPTWPREAFGFVVCEAAAAGCVPVMTAGIGASEWFMDGIDALKIHNDANGVSSAMLKLMFMPSRERRTMRRRAQATATRFFGSDRALSLLEAALSMDKSRGEPPSVRPRVVRAAEAAMGVLTAVWRNGARV